MAEDTITPSSSQQAVIALNRIANGISDNLLTLNANNLTNGTVPTARMPALTGDVTTAVGSVATTITANAVTNAKMAQMAAHTFKGNNTGSTADPIDLTSAQATADLDVMVADSGAGGTKGLVGAPAAGDAASHKFWGAGATWATALVRETAQTTTSGSSFDFTGVPSWVRKITCMFVGVSLSGTNNVLVQIGDSGGVSSSGYVSSSLFYNTTPAVFSVTSTAGIIINNGSTAANAISGTVVLVNITGSQWIASGTAQFDNAGTALISISGTKSLSNTLDRVRFTVTGADTFDAGSVNIIYE